VVTPQIVFGYIKINNEIRLCGTDPFTSLLCVLTNGGGFLSIQNAFLNARGASNAIIPSLQAAMLHTNESIRLTATSTLQVLKNGPTDSAQGDCELSIKKDGYNWWIQPIKKDGYSWPR